VLVMGLDGIPVSSDPRSSAVPPEPLMPPKTMFVLVNSPFVLGPGRMADAGQTLEIPYHFARELISANKVQEAEDPMVAAAAAQAVADRNADAKENLSEAAKAEKAEKAAKIKTAADAKAKDTGKDPTK